MFFFSCFHSVGKKKGIQMDESMSESDEEDEEDAIEVPPKKLKT